MCDTVLTHQHIGLKITGTTSTESGKIGGWKRDPDDDSHLRWYTAIERQVVGRCLGPIWSQPTMRGTNRRGRERG